MSALVFLAAAAVQSGKPPSLPPPRTDAPAPAFPPTRPGAAFAECEHCPEMVVLPSGSFIMGSTAKERRSLAVLAMFDKMEEPRHRVTITHKLAVGRYAVTFAQWDACVADGGCGGYRPDDAGWGRGRRPVIDVNFADANAYVDWLSQKTGQRYRLLSEAEWEYAGRAGTSSWYPFGNKITPEDANYGNNLDRTTEVGSYSSNRFGLYDMTANVAQWVADCHHETYVGAPTDGSAWLTGDCKFRNVRGGGWVLSGWSVRVAQRIGDPPGARNSHLGFRVAREY
jgi:formylglycine-generating enzyme required for sulfatase activity